MKESKFSNTFIKHLTILYGKRMWSLKIVGSERQSTDVPDWLFSINGRFVAIEFKVQRSKIISIKPRQIRELNKIKDSGSPGLLIAYDEDQDIILMMQRKLDPQIAMDKKKRVELEWDFDFNTYEEAITFLGRDILGGAHKEMGY